MDFDAEIKRLEDGIKQLQQQAERTAVLIIEATGALKQTRALKSQHDEQCDNCGIKPKAEK